MGDENPLAPIGELSKTGEALINRIAEAVGGLSKPWQIRRVAEAEADAAITEAKARIKITELEERALVRMVREEGKRQKNIEDITMKAIPDLREDAKPDKIEEDWLTNFFDKCRLISDDQMQMIWAKVLAGEANAPGAFSKRTIMLMSTIDKRDADTFTKLCGYNWDLNSKTSLIFDPLNEIYTRCGLTFGALNHLDSIGLVTMNNLTGYQLLNLGQQVLATYFGKSVVLSLPANNNSLSIGNVLLTEAGRELEKICKVSAVDGFQEYVLTEWMNKGITIFTPWMPKSKNI